MKVQMTYNGKTVEVEVADEQFEKLFADKKTGYEKSEKYYLINAHGEVMDSSDFDDEYLEKNRYEFANYFSDKSVAENMALAQRLWNRIHRRSVELCDPVDIRKNSWYYTINFDPISGDIYADNWITRRFGAIYFDTKEHCHKVIDEFHDELLWYFTQFKDRADM